jgi:voltage-gated potassium channel
MKRADRRGIRPRDAALLVSGFWALAVVVFGIVERAVDPKTFHSVWLGMWWAIETVTTVGYGDIVPESTAGKIIAGFLMLGGLSLISVLTAVITSGFVALAQQRRRASGDDPIGQRLNEITAELHAVNAKLDRLAPSTGSVDASAGPQDASAGPEDPGPAGPS